MSAYDAPGGRPGEVFERIVEAAGLREDLAARNLPLYVVPVGADGLAALREALLPRLGKEPWLSDLDAAAFCLYASRVFCRDHSGGRWKWRTVWEPLGIEIGDAERHSIIEQGLRAVGVRLLKLGRTRRFLTTCGLQGGLPLRALHGESTGGLRQWLQRTLERHEAYPNAPTEEVAQECATRDIPEGLRNADVYEVVGRLVSGIRSVRRYLPEQLPTEPGEVLTALDQANASWRHEIPLALSEDAARHLVGQLLLGASPRGTRTAPPFEVLTYLGEVSEEEEATGYGPLHHLPPAVNHGALAADAPVAVRTYEVRRSLRIAATIPLKEALPLKDEPARGRTYPLTLTSEADAAPAGELVWSQAKGCFQALTTEQEPLRGICSAVRLEGPDLTLPEPLPGSEELAEDVPWIFQALPTARLLALGGVSTAEEAVAVALPAGSQLMSGEPAAELGLAHGRRLVEVRGSVEVVDREGDHWAIRTGVEESKAGVIVLEGQRCPDFVEEDRVFIGLPRAVRSSAHAHRPMDQRWRPASATTSDEVMIGDGHLIVTEGEALIARRKVTLLPKSWQSHCHFEEGWDVRCPELLSLDAEDGSAEVSRSPTGYRIRVAPERADAVPVRLRFAGGATGVLHLRVHHRPYAFVSLSERVLPDEATVARAQLPEVRVQTAPAAEVPAGLLEMRVEEWRIPLALIHSVPKPAAGTLLRPSLSHFTPPLDAAFTLLENLDAKVNLQLRGTEPAGARPRELAVSRYARALRPENLVGGRVLIHCEATATSLRSEDLAPDIQVHARPLADALAEEIPLEGDVENGWTFDPDAHARGPWLMIARSGGVPCARPIRLAASGRVSDLERTPLQEAIASPRYEREIETVLPRLAEAPNTPDWQQLRAQLDLAVELGPRMVGAAKAVAHHPAVAVQAVLSAPDVQARGLAGLLEAEGLLWEAVPMATWKDALLHGVDDLDADVRTWILEKRVSRVAGLQAEITHAETLASLLAEDLGLPREGDFEARGRGDAHFCADANELLGDAVEGPYQRNLRRLGDLAGPKALPFQPVIPHLDRDLMRTAPGKRSLAENVLLAPIALIYTLRRVEGSALPSRWVQAMRPCRAAAPEWWRDVMYALWHHTVPNPD